MKSIKIFLSFILCFTMIISLVLPAFSAVQGDADGDGELTAADARLILRHSVGLEELNTSVLQDCDIDGDGEITPADARLALRFSVGLFEETPSEEETEPTTVEPTTVEPTTAEPTTAEPTTNAVPTKKEFIKKMADSVSYAEIDENIKLFANDIGSRWYTTTGMSRGKVYVIDILKYNGFKESEIKTDKFTCNGVAAYNVYTKITTSVKNPKIILFSAHYDSHYNGDGAVDTGSGLCTVLEIARILKAMNRDFGVEIRFAFFACEELGYYGAYRYVNYYASSELSRHVAVFNVDMSAHFTDKKNYYLCVSTKSAYGSSAKSNKPSLAVDEAKKVLGSCGEYKYLSPVAAGLHDLIPFEKNGVPAITLSWRVINSSASYGSDYGLAAPTLIHTSSDIYKNTDMQSLYKTTRLAAGAAGELVYGYLYGK